MKRNGIWIVLLIAVAVTFALGPAAWAASGEQVTVVGVLQQVKRKIYLTTDKDRFMVFGQDFSRLIGKKVKVTGKVTENYRGKSMIVSVMEIVRN